MSLYGTFTDIQAEFSFGLVFFSKTWARSSCFQVILTTVDNIGGACLASVKDFQEARHIVVSATVVDHLWVITGRMNYITEAYLPSVINSQQGILC